MTDKPRGLSRATAFVFRIATDATWVFVIVLALSLGSSLFSIRYLSGLESDIGDLYENDIKGQTYAQNAYVTAIGLESTVKDLIVSENSDERLSAAELLETASASLRSLVLKATPTIDSAKYRTLVAKSKTDAASLMAAVLKGLERAGEGAPSQEEGRAILAGMKPSLAALKNDLTILNDIKRSSNRSGIKAVQVQLRISLAITIAILVVSLAFRIAVFRASRVAAKRALANDCPDLETSQALSDRRPPSSSEGLR
jgi:hypothetical protein